MRALKQNEEREVLARVTDDEKNILAKAELEDSITEIMSCYDVEDDNLINRTAPRSELRVGRTLSVSRTRGDGRRRESAPESRSQSLPLLRGSAPACGARAAAGQAGAALERMAAAPRERSP